MSKKAFIFDLDSVSRIESLQKILSWGNVSISNEWFDELISKKNNDYLLYINNMGFCRI